jgi:ATP-dependent DNA helicase HFM1/MER3
MKRKTIDLDSINIGKQRKEVNFGKILERDSKQRIRNDFNNPNFLIKKTNTVFTDIFEDQVFNEDDMFNDFLKETDDDIGDFSFESKLSNSKPRTKGNIVDYFKVKKPRIDLRHESAKQDKLIDSFKEEKPQNHQEVNEKDETKQYPLNKILTHDKLNPIQTDCFELLYKTNKHSLITAPTGSGKTTLFEIGIGRVVKENLDSSNRFINKNFKIIYLAPIKSLCQEKFNEWRIKFFGLELNVVEATGDSEFVNYSLLNSANIILSTPERWDVISRKWRDYSSLIGNINLFMIDEIHLLNEETRGGTLEAVVARLKLLSTIRLFENTPLKNFRIIALSATIPNLNEVAEWLEVPSEALKKFGEEFRPVQIERIVLGYNMDKNEYLFEKYLNFRLADLIIRYSDNRPSLIFCQTQKGTVTAAQQLLSEAERLFNFTTEERIHLLQLSDQIKDKQLNNVLKVGVAFHNAGLTLSDRQLVEDLFKKGISNII